MSLLPAILTLTEKFQRKYGYAKSIRVGAAGGISTPSSALGAFMMGAAYVVTGSVNQSCIEAAASKHSKNLLAQAEMADVTMAPAADMFEMGVELQVLKRGTMFPMRAKKLYELYKKYELHAQIIIKLIRRVVMSTDLPSTKELNEDFRSHKKQLEEIFRQKENISPNKYF